jgi:REP element-mobilizing transposase RayT
MPQSLSHLLVHLVFSTKDRSACLSDEARPELHSYIAGVLANCKCRPIIINSVPDHVHVLFDLARDQALSGVVEKIKANSSRWLKTKSPALASFQWQRGYSAFAVSKSNMEAVRSYIERQKEHHHKTSFMEELKKFLDKHSIKYDERYLWD